MGMSLPYSSSSPAESKEKTEECLKAGSAIKRLMEQNIRPRDIMTRDAFDNAIKLIMVLGGKMPLVHSFQTDHFREHKCGDPSDCHGPRV
jgi:dihydroxy-acid dehydratase